jgi:hypothetical protein
MPIFTASPSILVTLIWIESPMMIPSFTFLDKISILNTFYNLRSWFAPCFGMFSGRRLPVMFSLSSRGSFDEEPLLEPFVLPEAFVQSIA